MASDAEKGFAGGKIDESARVVKPQKVPLDFFLPSERGKKSNDAKSAKQGEEGMRRDAMQ
jgi:hypothetical protein